MHAPLSLDAASGAIALDAAADAAERAGRHSEAVRWREQAVALAPRDVARLNRLATSLRLAGRPTESARVCVQAMALAPAEPALHCNFGTALCDLGLFDEAATAIETATLLAPAHSGLRHRLGSAYLYGRQWDRAEEAYEAALSLDPGNADACNGLGAVAFARYRFDEALAHFERAHRIAPGNRECLSNIGSVRARLGDLDGAIAAFRSVLADEPGQPLARWGLALTLLARGDAAAGWPLHEARLDCVHLRANYARWRDALEAMPRWSGDAARGRTILLVPEQGLGDTLQNWRFALALRDHGWTVRAMVPAPLEGLFKAQREPGIEVHPETGPIPHADCCELFFSLPWRLQMHDAAPDALARRAGYLRAPADGARHWRQRLEAEAPQALRVGLVWAGRPEHSNDRLRSLRLRDAAPLLELPGVRWFSLQKGPAQAQIAELGWGGRLVDLAPAIDGFDDTAGAMQALDAVVTVDSAPAHLAGALGRPALVLLPAVPDWRWGTAGSHSPWYDSLTLVRQAPDRPWDALMPDVAARVAALRDAVQ